MVMGIMERTSPTTTAANRDVAQNGRPSPRDRVALVLPVHHRMNLSFSVVGFVAPAAGGERRVQPPARPGVRPPAAKPCVPVAPCVVKPKIPMRPVAPRPPRLR